MTESISAKDPAALRAQSRESWEGAADGWAKWDPVISNWMAPGTAALLEMAGLKPGARVLDLACGAGNQTLQAAARVGPEGAILACDLSAAMLSHVAARAAAAGHDHVETLEGAAEELDLAPASLDAAICRLGLMLFAEPVKALEAVKPALKPGARKAALVFTTAAANPFMSEPRAIARRLGKLPAPDPDAPGAFTLGGPGALAERFAAAGFVAYEERTVAIEVRLPTAADGIALMLEASGSYRAMLAEIDPPTREVVLAEVTAFLNGYLSGEGLSIPGEVRVGAAARPE